MTSVIFGRNWPTVPQTAGLSLPLTLRPILPKQSIIYVDYLIKMDSNYANKGDELIKKGDKQLKGSTFGNIFGSKQERAEKAIESYKSAATQYKLAKKWEQAAEAYLKCVYCDEILQSGEMADFYIEAAKAVQNVNRADAIQYYEKAIE